MWLDFTYPWMLLLISICGIVVWLTARRWPSKTKKSRISHGLRYALILLTVLSLSGTSIPGTSRGKAAWILVDASDSMTEQQDAVAGVIRDALSENEDGQEVGVIAFGKDAMVEVPLSESPVYRGITTAIDATGSNLDQALALAGALLPSDVSGGIAVVSDGLLNEVDSSVLQSRGIAVNTLLLSDMDMVDAQITSLDIPGTAYQGQSISVTVTVHASKASDATIVLTANRNTAATRDVSLMKGENTFVFRDVVAQPGVVTYEAQVIMPDDRVSQNDRAGAFITVSGAPSILIVEGQPDSGRELEKMLISAGMRTETILPAAMMDSAVELRAYNGIALANVDADRLTDQQISALDTAAKEFGVGLAVFGGDNSYALGGYRGSALENILPVTIDVRNKMDLPSTALVLVIDKSGSMTDGQYGVSRLDVAKEAACRAIEVLTEQDQAGVIAFDDEGKWVVPLSYATDVAAMQEQIGTIRSGGGTAFFTPLAMAYDALDAAVARHKHIIFLTDGQSGDKGYEELAEDMAAKGITLTTVAVGNGADTEIMQKLAALGGGRAYAAGQFDNVPKIFTKETMLISGSYVQNRRFTPIVTDESLTDFPGFPTLDGYLATTERALATVSLVSDRGDPILAWWQYGAGKVLCWTSDVQGAWSSGFLSWEDAAAFFGGLISHILPMQRQDGEMQLENGKLSYISQHTAEGAKVTAQVLLPDGSLQNLDLQQVSPSRYEADVETVQTGAYAVQIEMTQDGELVAALDGGMITPYSQEYDMRATDMGVLETLSRETGGVCTTVGSEMLSFPETTTHTRVSLQPYLLWAALALLVADIAQTRLNWEKSIQKKTISVREKQSAIKRQPHRREEKPVSDPTKTSEQLWQNLQKKQRL